MADDIDIEEHDVLDNPRIRQILPSLLDIAIKTEVPDRDDDYEMEITSNYSRHGNEDDNTNSDSHQALACEEEVTGQPMQFEEEQINHSDEHGNSAEYVVRNNRIILGNKPESSHSGNNTSQSLIFGFNHLTHVKTEPLDYEENEEEEEDEPFVEDRVVATHTPVMILGSKPNKDLQESRNDDWNRNESSKYVSYDDDDGESTRIHHNTCPMYLSVYLEDWGPRLERSTRYCYECQILFPTRNCLDAHKMSAHSFLVALDTNVAIKSTAKSHEFKSTARKSTHHEASTSKSGFCNHCNKTFADDTALIKHLYEIVTSKKKIKCELCHEVFPNETELQAHMKTHEKREIVEDNDFKLQHTEYRCRVCGFYSKLLNVMQRHMSENHKLQVYKLEKVAFDPKCIHCDHVAVNHNAHIKNVHLTQYYMNGNILKTGHKTTDFETKFQCNICKKVLPSYGEARRHRKCVHAETKNTILFSKITKRKMKYQFVHKVPLSKTLVKQVDAINLKKVSDNDVTTDVSKLVPKDVLFRCHCLVHYTNYSTACVHACKCSKTERSDVINAYRCPHCKRKISLEDQKIHEIQHKLTEKFKVYHVNDRVYSTILCKCPNCSLYFNEQDLLEHSQGMCDKKYSFKCGQCHLSIGNTSKEVHSKMHKTLNVSVNELILIDCVSSATVNRKRTHSEIETDTKQNANKSFKVFVCRKCHGCFFRKNKDHKINCKGFNRLQRICKHCGLDFPTKNHYQFHGALPNVTLKNFKFYDYSSTNKPVPIPIPENPRCDKCLVHFVGQVAKMKHECNDHYKTCHHCNKKFSDLALRLHLPLHAYKVDDMKTVKPLALAPPLLPDSEATKDMPELLKKYEQLTNIWNLLYLCKDCKTACDSYDKMVEHCQDHLCKPGNGFGGVRECKKCTITFDVSSFENHVKLHSANRNLNNECFRIITYDYNKLLSEQWLDIFQDLPVDQVNSIVSKSIYQHTRAVRMTVSNNVKSDYKLYKCAKCLKYLHPVSLPMHIKMMSCSMQKSFWCKICKINFSSSTAKMSHLSDHKILGIGNKIKATEVVVNRQEDYEDNKILEKVDCVTPMNVGLKRKAEFVYYVCKKCKICKKKRWNILKHKCALSKNRIKQCSKCKFIFLTKGFNKHEELHKKHPNLKRADISIALFDPVTRDIQPPKESIPLKGDKIAAIFKCRCGLHFTSETLLRDHSDKCRPGNSISGEKCSKCGLLFPTDLLVSHLCRHHRESDTHMKVISDSIPLFKCKKCNLCYLGMRALRRHITRNHTKIGVKICHKCGLQFTQNTYTRHIRKHHGSNETNLRWFHVKEFAGTNMVGEAYVLLSGKAEDRKALPKQVENTVAISGKVESAEDIYVNKGNKSVKTIKKPGGSKNKNCYLFKCSRCQLHIMPKPQMFHKHKKMRCHDVTVKIQSKKCPVCLLPFEIKELVRHISLHHKQMNLKLRDFCIVPRDPLGKNAPFKYVLGQEHASLLLKAGYEKVLYMCDKCGLSFLRENSFSKHNCEALKYKCDQCGHSFTVQSLSRHKLIHHVIMKLKREDFVVFSRESKDVAVTDTVSKSMKHVANVLFNCTKCGLSFLRNNTLYSHKCTSSSLKVRCTKCNYKFTRKSLALHKVIHHDKMKLNRKDIRIITTKDSKPDTANESIQNLSIVTDNESEDFESVDETNNDETDLDTSKNKSGKSIPISAKVNNDTKEENDFKANSLRPNSVRSKFELSGSFKPLFDRVTKYGKNLYNCHCCNVNFLSANTLIKHSQGKLCRNIARKVSCDQCGYIFSTHSLARHIEIHHVQMELKREDLRIISLEEVRSKSQHDLDETDHAEIENLDKTVDDIDRDSFTNESINSTPVPSEIDDSMKETEDLNTPHDRYKRSKYRLSKQSKISLNVRRYGKVLYNCSKCDLSFLNERTLENHLEQRCKVYVKVRCDECHYIFTPNSLARHKEIHHARMNLKREDILIVFPKQLKTGNSSGNMRDRLAFEDTASEDFEKKEIESGTIFDTSENSVQSLNKTDKVEIQYLESDMTKGCFGSFLKDISTLYKCHKCSICFVDSVSCKEHIQNELCDSKSEECDECGYEFADETNKHKKIHHVDNKFNVEDFQIVQLSFVNSKFVTNCLFKCGKCFKNFLSETEVLGHLCEFKYDSKERCEVCNFTFRSEDLLQHFKLHHEIMELKRDFQVIMRVPLENLNGGDDDQSNIDNPYLDTLDWSLYSNDVWCCNKCTVHLLSEDKFTKHLTKCSGNVDKRRCDNCDLEFSEHGITVHKYVHHKVMNLEREDINIVFPNDSNTNNLHSGKPIYDKVLYKCEKCSLHFIKLVTLKKHVHPTKSFKCQFCGLKFPYYSLARHIAMHHENLKLRREDIQIKLLSSDNNEVLNNTAPEVSNIIDLSDIRSSPLPPTVKQYKNTKLRKHTLKPFDKIVLDRMRYDNKVYKCKNCTLHYLDEVAAKKHEWCCDNTVKPIPCEVCNIEFSYITLEKHMYVHHERMGLKKGEIFKADRVFDKPKLYKCGVCKTHFINEVELNMHMINKCHRILKTECKVCKLQFALVKLSAHFDIHHSRKQLAANDFVIIEKHEKAFEDSIINMNVDSSVKKSETKTKPNEKNETKVPRIFMCAECEVYFNTYPSFMQHANSHKKLDIKEYIDCKLCSLPFKILSLQKHVQTHHVDGFDFENLLIEEYLPKTDGLVKINTYFVKDKIQSKLVSTTTTDISSSDVKNVNKIEVKVTESESVQDDCDTNDSIKNVDSDFSKTINVEEEMVCSENQSNENGIKTEVNVNSNSDTEMDRVEILDDYDDKVDNIDDSNVVQKSLDSDCSKTINVKEEMVCSENDSDDNEVSAEVKINSNNDTEMDCVEILDDSNDKVDKIDDSNVVQKSLNSDCSKTINVKEEMVCFENDSDDNEVSAEVKVNSNNDAEMDCVEILDDSDDKVDKIDDSNIVKTESHFLKALNDDDEEELEFMDCIDLT